jgi:predicted kinase
MQKLIVLMGNIGSGKSTFARKLADEGAVIVDLDSIVTMVHGGNYKGYKEEWKGLYKVIQSAIISTAIKNNKDIAIDDSNMKKSRRQSLIHLGEFWQLKVICYDFGPGTEEGLKRRMKQLKGHKPEYWVPVYKKLKNQYERPTIEEGFDEINGVKVIPVYKSAFSKKIIESKFDISTKIVKTIN